MVNFGKIKRKHLPVYEVDIANNSISDDFLKNVSQLLETVHKSANPRYVQHQDGHSYVEKEPSCESNEDYQSEF